MGPLVGVFQIVIRHVKAGNLIRGSEVFLSLPFFLSCLDCLHIATSCSARLRNLGVGFICLTIALNWAVTFDSDCARDVLKFWREAAVLKIKVNLKLWIMRVLKLGLQP